MGKKEYTHSNFDKKGGEFRNYKDIETGEKFVEYIPPNKSGNNAVFGPDGKKINPKT